MQLPDNASEMLDAIEFSNMALENDFSKVVNGAARLRGDVNRYVRRNTDMLPECLSLYDSGEYSADDLRDIIVGCIEDFNYIYKAIDKLCAQNDEIRKDFYESMLH